MNNNNSVLMFIKNICILVLWKKAASALEALGMETSKNETVQYGIVTGETVQYINGTLIHHKFCCE